MNDSVLQLLKCVHVLKVLLVRSFKITAFKIPIYYLPGPNKCEPAMKQAAHNAK